MLIDWGWFGFEEVRMWARASDSNSPSVQGVTFTPIKFPQRWLLCGKIGKKVMSRLPWALREKEGYERASKA